MNPFEIIGISILFTAQIVGLFLWKRERQKHANELKRHQQEWAHLQQRLHSEETRFHRLAALLTELHRFRASPNGRASRTEFAQGVVDTARALLEADLSLFLQLDPTTLELTATSGGGVAPENLARLTVRSGEGPLGRAVQSRTILALKEAESSTIDFIPTPCLVIPITMQDRVMGLLIVAKPRAGRFSEEALSLAELLSSEAGMTLENMELDDSLHRSYEDLVAALARAIRAKDTITHTHSDRTQALVQFLAQELHLPGQLVRQIEQGGLLHDVGKLGIDDVILKKPGKLTTEEYTEMKRHPEIGFQILEPVPFLRQVATIVLYHQEWYNGQGYPEGLAGEEIPLGARIVQVIDAWDAMTSDRPYRKAMSKSAAVAELRRQAGTQFDPKIVEAFLHVIDRLEREGVPITEHQVEEMTHA